MHVGLPACEVIGTLVKSKYCAIDRLWVELIERLLAQLSEIWVRDFMVEVLCLTIGL